MPRIYPHKYEVVIERRSSVNGRRLVPITVLRTDDHDEALATYRRRWATRSAGSTPRLITRTTRAEAGW